MTKKMSSNNPSAIQKVSELTLRVTVPPSEQNIWRKLMSECLKSKLRVVKTHLFKKLLQKKLGTSVIENYLKREVRSSSDVAKIRRKHLKCNEGGNVCKSKDTTTPVVQDELDI